MNKILIASKDLNFIKSIINSMDEVEYKITNLSTNFKETLSNILNNELDFVIIDLILSMEQINNIIKLLDDIKRETSVIFLNLTKDIKCQNKNIYFFKKEISKEFVFSYLRYMLKNNFIKKDENLELENKIWKEMISAGFEMKNKGDLLLLEVIKYIKLKGKTNSNLKQDIYPYIARMLNISIGKIKWNIIYSINRTYLYNSEMMEKYLQENLKNKPTPKYIIYKILEKI